MAKAKHQCTVIPVLKKHDCFLETPLVYLWSFAGAVRFCATECPTVPCNRRMVKKAIRAMCGRIPAEGT